jgi:hypothetical protein
VHIRVYSHFHHWIKLATERKRVIGEIRGKHRDRILLPYLRFKIMLVSSLVCQRGRESLGNFDGLSDRVC